MHPHESLQHAVVGNAADAQDIRTDCTPALLMSCLCCSLAKKRVAEKKVAITVFSFPPDKGNVGTAAYLNVFGSIYKVLQDLKSQGYTVDGVPEQEEDLIKLVSRGIRTLLVHTMEPEPCLYKPRKQNPACTHHGIRTLLVIPCLSYHAGLKAFFWLLSVVWEFKA